MLLTAGERVLLHLLHFWNIREPNDAITQRGIAESIAVRRSHVPRTVKALAREGHLEERAGRVGGRGRKVKLYYLTAPGLQRARELADTFGGQTIVTDGGPMTVAEFAKASGRTLAAIATDIDESGRYRGPARDEGVPDFLDRRDELAALAAWTRGDVPAMVVYASVGMGKTALARRFLHRPSRTVWWRDLQKGDTSAALLEDLGAFLADQGRSGLRTALEEGEDPWEPLALDLRDSGFLLVVDNYGDVPEDVVDFTARLLRSTQAASQKVLVLAQEATPSYCRFYDRGAVESGRVEELHLRGLSPEDSRTLLGSDDIAEEAFRRIYLLTKGCPLYLELIREGDADALKARSRFTTPEVNFLLFSKDVVA